MSAATRLLLLVLVCQPVSSWAAPYSGGQGTPQAPFLISTAEDFKAIGENPADWDKTFKLTQNIDLSGYDETKLRMIGRWKALGSWDNQPFRGIFDGNGKTIANFRYLNLREEYVGLFQHVTGDIKNLTLLRPTVMGDQLGTGALVGYLEKGSIRDCAVREADVSGYYGVGGLVGVAHSSVHRSWSHGVVSGVRYVGGLVGQVYGTVALSCSKARVIGEESVGGLAGAMMGVGSIVDSSYARGEVKGKVYVGGLVGQVEAGRVYQCYATGKVSGTQSVGGLVGYQRALAQVMASLWDTQSSTQATSVGGTGKTTAEMKAVDTFWSMNWDFTEVWTICEGINYPVLLWQIPLADLDCPDGVSFIDFALLAANWRSRNCRNANRYCSGADLDRSGAVDLRDLALFAGDWLAGTE
ncbi:MAG: hypothetical protein FJ280_29800 [Planctomycetes bacterium]|nr:hypothetical protein [Planctomycetota bacterium]